MYRCPLDKLKVRKKLTKKNWKVGTEEQQKNLKKRDAMLAGLVMLDLSKHIFE
mgnify:CR=1 FL=1